MNDKQDEVVVTLEKRVMSELKVSHPLDSPDFNPTDYINQLFPNQQSLSSIDVVLDNIKQKTAHVKQETQRRTTMHAAQGNADQALDSTKTAIQGLFQNIQEIKGKAAQSEAMVQDITRDVKILDHAKRHLTHSVTVLKRLQMLVTAVDQLETMAANKQYKECAQLLQAVMQLMQQFKTYKSVPQIASLFDRIRQLQNSLETSVLNDFKLGFNSEGALRSASWFLHDGCLVASVLGDATRDKFIRHYVDLQLAGYRQIFRPAEEVSQIDNISRRYAFFKRVLKTFDEDHADIFPADWCISGRLADKFCAFTKTDLEQILANRQPDMMDLLKALQMTIEFESQLAKRYEKQVQPSDGQSMPTFQFEKSVSSAFMPYLWIYIEAKDKTLAEMIQQYPQSDKAADDDTITVLPSSTDLFYFYRETLSQCARFSTGGALWDLCQLFAKYLLTYRDKVLLAGIARDERLPLSMDHLRLVVLTLNTADYCSLTTSQLEEKLRDQIVDDYKEKVNLEYVQDAFKTTISTCIDVLIKQLHGAFDSSFQQMMRLGWGDYDTVGDQSSFISELQETATRAISMIGRSISNKRYFRTFCDRFADSLLTKYFTTIFKCRVISEIGAEQMLLDTHSIKTLLYDIPTLSSQGATMPAMYSKLVNRGIAKIEMVLKTVMTPADPPEGYVENYLFLMGDRHPSNFTRLLDLKGIKRPDHPPLMDLFQRRATQHASLPSNPNLLPMVSAIDATSPPTSHPLHQHHAPQTSPSVPSLSSLAASAHSLSSFTRSVTSTPSSPTPADTASTNAKTRLNENFMKIVKTGMAFRKDLQDRRDQL
ncbi:Vps53-like protein [Gongronella butleri]|nr:Vps53-like protein [Gongronella butleri]